jgi:hypothetical protein
MHAMPDTTAPSPVIAEPPAYFAEALADAERLLKYAAESGMSIDDATRDSVLQARAASSSGWTEEAAAKLITALTSLAALARPVTAASLKACQDEIKPTARIYFWSAIFLAALIVPFSVASFLVSAISTTIRSDISTANDLALKLNKQTRPPQPQPQPLTTVPTTAAPKNTASQTAATPASIAPPPPPKFVPCSVSSTPGPVVPLPPGVNPDDVISELQQYAILIRSIDAHARQLNALVPWREGDPCGGIRNKPAELHKVFELPAGIPNLVQAADDRTAIYQQVRFFAQSDLDVSSFLYGAITIVILPVLYALLGTCAYLLRNFEHQMSARTFMPSQANSARFFIAGIGGGVVGLFNIAQGASASPLAIAFLVGYGVDVFFAFLEGLLQQFTRNASPPAPSARSEAK